MFIKVPPYLALGGCKKDDDDGNIGLFLVLDFLFQGFVWVLTNDFNE